MTNGVVSIVRDGRVIFKVVCGCDGYNAGELVAALTREQPNTLEQIYELAEAAGFGSEDCLVVMSADGVLFKGEDELSPLYRDKFGDPKFNPRWKRGTAAYVEVVGYE